MSMMVSPYRFAISGPGATSVTFVGSKVASNTNTSGWQAVSLTDLKDESNNDATLQHGDLVMLFLNYTTTATDLTAAELTGWGFEAAHTDITAFDNVRANMLAQYRFMGPTPDSSIQLPPFSGSNVQVLAIYAFRGVDPTTTIDVAVTTANGTNTGVADCPSLTPSTTGAMVIAFGGAAGDTNATDYTNPTGMSSTTNHFRTTSSTAAINDGAVGVALKTDWGSGAYDPPAFGGGPTGTNFCWAAATIALRPDQTTYPTSLSGSYATLTIASGKVSSNLTEQPVYVNLADMPSGFWSAVASDGSNIRVTSSDGLTILPIDVANINVGATTGRLYFRAPSILSGSSNSWRIYYNTGLSALPANHKHGARMVWRGRYKIVVDGYENKNRAAPGTFTLVDNAAFTSGAIAFDGANDGAYIAIPSPSTIVSMLAVGYLASGGGTHKGVAAYADLYGGSPNRINLAVRSTNNWSTWNPTNSWYETATAATFNANFTAALVHQGGTSREVFVNGSSAGSNATAVNPTISAAPIFMLGAEDSSYLEEMSGSIAFAVYTDRAMSAAEIKCIHDNWRTSFYTIV